jgi:hypothetical protein
MRVRFVVGVPSMVEMEAGIEVDDGVPVGFVSKALRKPYANIISVVIHERRKRWVRMSSGEYSTGQTYDTQMSWLTLREPRRLEKFP